MAPAKSHITPAVSSTICVQNCCTMSYWAASCRLAHTEGGNQLAAPQYILQERAKMGKIGRMTLVCVPSVGSDTRWAQPSIAICPHVTYGMSDAIRHS